MASNSPHTSSTPSLTATYKCPNNAPFTIAEPVAASSSPPPTTGNSPEPKRAQVAAKSQHLASLRAALATAQDTINRELTARMEEDRERDAKTGSGAGGGDKSVDDSKEEENYGEEVAEEEDD